MEGSTDIPEHGGGSKAGTPNPAQQRAIEHDDGPLIVLAGPGTGKTRVIADRVAHRMNALGAAPESILAVTFTTKAAGELRRRIADVVGGARAERLEARTFHGLCWRWLGRFADLSGLGRAPVLMDSALRRRHIRGAIIESGAFPAHRREGLGALVERVEPFISRCANHAITPARAMAHAAEWADSLERQDTGDDQRLAAEHARLDLFTHCARVYEASDALRRATGRVSFDDMLLDTVRMLEEQPAVRAILRDEYRHVVADEFQDVNTAQIELLRLLCPPERRPDLAVVGDDDQSIYAFRGADDRAFERFERVWPGATTIALTENYRSASPIIEASGAIIKRADSRFRPDKVIVRAASRGPDPAGSEVRAVTYARDDSSQEALVVARILAEAHELERTPWRRMAVLSRSRARRTRIADALRAEGIPHVVQREGDISEEDAGRDAFAWIDLLIEPDAASSARRLLCRPPFSLRPAAVVRWENEYVAERAASGGPDRPRSFVAWLEGRTRDPTAHRFARRVAELAEIVARASAVEAIDAITRIGELGHADLATPKSRAERVGSLVELLALVRRVQPSLERPGDLRAFRAHFNELTEGDRCGDTYAGTEAIDGTEQDEQDDGVRLLTAHGAKGLEFDTVVLVGAQPGAGGFPSTRSNDEPEVDLPAALLGRPHEADARARAMDEERRLFYVAMTRAERRVVICTAEQKSRTTSTHFAQELMRKFGSGLVHEAPASHWLERPEPGQATLFGRTAAERRQDALNRAEERRAIRLHAAAALDNAESAGGDKARLREAIAQLREAAEALAAPAKASMPRDDSLRALFKPVQPPIRLSYTSVSDYERCPRCYYMKHVLRLGDAPSAHTAMGTAVHGALQEFFRAWREADSNGREPPGEAFLRACAERAFTDAIARTAASVRLELEDVWALARGALDLHDPNTNILDCERREQWAFPVGGVEHTIEARFDRLDQGPDGRYRIIDYKTGKARDELLKPPAEDLQFSIYAMALRHQDPDARGTAEYWVLRTGARGVIDLDALDLDGAQARIENMARGVREGRFSQACHIKRNKQREPWLGVCAFLGPDGPAATP